MSYHIHQIIELQFCVCVCWKLLRSTLLATLQYAAQYRDCGHYAVYYISKTDLFYNAEFVPLTMYVPYILSTQFRP